MGKEYGGKITVRFSSGETLSLRGTLTMNTAGQSNEAVVNQDGSVDRVGTPTARKAELNFADRGLDLNTLMTAGRFNVTVIEEFAGVMHLFTNAFVVGDPSINRANGEVSGLSINSEGYSRSDL